ncbi:MAG: hypothetical protein P0S96_01915 [Simkaniaceae bacterium]|nr:hypothetical protein [Candidatus Sacchlamyda saccharinae]
MSVLQEQTQNILPKESVIVPFSHEVAKRERQERKELAKLKTVLHFVEKEVAKAKQKASANGQDTGINGNALTSMTFSPAALAMPMILKTITLDALIMQLQSRQAQTMSKSEIVAAKSQYKETVAAGEAAWNAALVAAICTGASALLSVVAYAGIRTKIMSGTRSELSELNKELKPINNIDERLTTLEPSEHTAGRGWADSDGANPFNDQDTINTRMSELQDHNYSNFGEIKEGSEEEVAIKRFKNGQNADGTRFDYDEWRKEFLQRRDAKNQEIQNTHSRLSEVSNYANMSTQVLNSLGQSGSGIAQGHGRKEETEHQGMAGLAGAESQMQARAASTSDQDIVAQINNQKGAFQTLETIDRANSTQ